MPRNRLGIASGILSMVRTLGQVTGIAALGAFFASRVSAYSGGSTSLDNASANAIVFALHDQFLLVAALIGFGLVVSIITWWYEARTARSNETIGEAPKPSIEGA